MKKILFRIPLAVITAGIFIGLSQPVHAQAFTPNANQVCFYEHENYGGNYICISSSGEYVDLGRYFVGTSNNNWHDKISSVIIGKNACAIMYEHPNGGGYCLTLRGNGTSTRKIPKLSPYNFNDKASHIKSLAYPENLPPEPYPNEVYFFEHSNYDGYYLLMSQDDDIPDLTRYTLSETVTYNWNDRISSIRIGSNSALTTWFNINYSGQKTGYKANGSNTFSIPDLAPLGVGDKWSSFKVRDRDHWIQ